MVSSEISFTMDDESEGGILIVPSDRSEAVVSTLSLPDSVPTHLNSLPGPLLLEPLVTGDMGQSRSSSHSQASSSTVSAPPPRWMIWTLVALGVALVGSTGVSVMLWRQHQTALDRIQAQQAFLERQHEESSSCPSIGQALHERAQSVWDQFQKDYREFEQQAVVQQRKISDVAKSIPKKAVAVSVGAGLLVGAVQSLFRGEEDSIMDPNDF